MDLEKNITETLKQALPGLQAIYLFGSQAQGTGYPGSDVDVAILDRDLVPPEACWDLAQQLAGTLKADVDLIDLRQATTVMRKEVVAKGRRIYCKELFSVEQYEDYVFSSYARLNEERQEILASIRKKGSVYG